MLGGCSQRYCESVAVQGKGQKFPSSGLAKRKWLCNDFPMFKKPLLLLCAGFLACAAHVHAQDPAEPDTKDKAGDSAGPARFWQATLGGGHYMVALDRIASVSRHKYVLDGALIIDEVTVDTVGQALARFYFITPITDAAPGNSITGLAARSRELVEKAADRVGTDVQNMVVKKYPDTSHAKSIEYRILSEAELTALYASVRSSWETGRGRKFTAK
jgi:hypothetical protein